MLQHHRTSAQGLRASNTPQIWPGSTRSGRHTPEGRRPASTRRIRGTSTRPRLAATTPGRAHPGPRPRAPSPGRHRARPCTTPARPGRAVAGARSARLAASAAGRATPSPRRPALKNRSVVLVVYAEPCDAGRPASPATSLSSSSGAGDRDRRPVDSRASLEPPTFSSTSQ